MSKKALADRMIADGSFHKRADAETAADAVFTALAGSVRDGQPITIQQFGRFTMKDRKARMGRNPQTGAPLEIPAKSEISFKPS